ncbi:MAG: hypothetical protein GVY36_19270 [Verrucomicrobia bacterium]|jgi:hypothetical protein|nr:hypothetical protein [Verrucomicrobiota bacterium]
MQAERVAIIGLDGDDRPRVSGGRPRLPDLTEVFDQYRGNAEVVNGAINSTVTTFRTTGLDEAVSWLV